MIKIAICDDNKPMLDFLKEKISEKFAEKEILCEISVFLTGFDFIESHAKDPFDVIFLDIVMPEKDGFEVAKHVRKMSRDTYIIFITTESSLVYDSFDFQPFHFIPKSNLRITESKLEYVIDKLSIHMAVSEKIIINGAYGTKKYISPKEILYIKSCINNVEYHLEDGSSFSARGKLDDISSTLNSYIFTRTHKRFIVNMQHIDSIDYPNMEIRLDNGEFIVISRGRKKDLEETYLRFMRNFS